MATLNEYLKEYLKNEKIGDYATYLSRIGELSSEGAEALAATDTQTAKSIATYGSKAAQLSDMGLSESGYADYLTGVAYAERRQAREALAKSERQSYASALMAEKEQAEKNRLSALAKIRSASIMDEDAAYRYALALGLEESEAREVAAQAVDSYVNSQTRLASVLQYCIEQGFYRQQALAYATALGYGESDANRIADMIDTYRSMYYGGNKNKK